MTQTGGHLWMEGHYNRLSVTQWDHGIACCYLLTGCRERS